MFRFRNKNNNMNSEQFEILLKVDSEKTHLNSL